MRSAPPVSSPVIRWTMVIIGNPSRFETGCAVKCLRLSPCSSHAPGIGYLTPTRDPSNDVMPRHGTHQGVPGRRQLLRHFGGVLKELVARALGSAAATGQMRILARSAARTGLVARSMATIALGSLSNSLGSRLKTVLVRGGSGARPHP